MLLFDEFDVLTSQEEQQLPEASAAYAFIPVMRRLIEQEPQLTFVFVMGRKADELSIEFLSAFKHRSSDPYLCAGPGIGAIPGADRTARRAMLTFADGVPDRILALTVGHPLLHSAFMPTAL